MVKAFIGVDPGTNGAFCLLVPEFKIIEYRKTTDKPIDIVNWLVEANQNYDSIATIEDVHSLYGMSAKSNFSFGFNTGHSTALLQAADYSLNKVAPKVWQKAIGVTVKGKAIKQEVANIALALYPHTNLYTPRGKLLDGKSDALMIAHYSYITLDK